MNRNSEISCCFKGKLTLSSCNSTKAGKSENGLSDWAIYYAVLKSFVLFREVLKSISMSEGSFLAFLSLAAFVMHGGFYVKGETDSLFKFSYKLLASANNLQALHVIWVTRSSMASKTRSIFNSFILF